jgi:ketosteroid isomerase-like protein
MAIANRAVCCLLLPFLISSASGITSPNQLEQAAEKALTARQKVMQEHATASDVNAFLALFTDDMIYEDPVVKMKIEGKDEVRKGMVLFLGASRSARIVVSKRISAANVVVLEQTVSFEEKQEDNSWRPQSRRQVTVFEFEGAKIHRIADYWSR